MNLKKYLLETLIIRAGRGVHNKTLTITNDGETIWNEIEKILKERIPSLKSSRGLMSLFLETMIRRCEVVLKREDEETKAILKRMENGKNKKKAHISEQSQTQNKKDMQAVPSL